MANILRRKTNIQQKFNLLLCYMLVFLCVFFPYDIYNLKLMCLFGMMLFNWRIILKNLLKTKQDRITFLISIGFGAYLMFLSFMANGSLGNAVRGAYVSLLLMVLYVVRYQRIDLCKIIIHVLKLLALVILLCVALDAVKILDIYDNPILNYMYENKEIAVVTKAVKYYSYYKIYFKASSLLVILTCYTLKKRQYLWWLMSGAALWFTGSSAPVAAFAFCSLILGIHTLRRIKLSRLFIVISVAICFMFVVAAFLLSSPDMMIRQSIIMDYVNLLLESPIRLISGFGYGTPIFLSARGTFEVATEWSFIEFLRQFGLLGFVPLLFYLFAPVKRISMTENYWAIYALMGYIVIASTNPLLFTSTAMVLYMLVYYYYEKAEHENLRSSIRV